jgi:glycosyltransferase involved in cell wall biosynthesis
LNVLAKKQKKIVHIITGLNDGGAEAVLYRLCKYDTTNTHVVISMMDQGKYGPLLCDCGIDVHCLGMPRRKLKLKGLYRLRKHLKKERPDVIQTWMYHGDLVGGVIARISGYKSICWGIRHSTLEEGKSARSTILVAKLCSLLSRVVPAKIICCSQKAAEVHQQLGYRENKIVVIPNGYDLDQFSPDQEARQRLRTEWGISDDLPLLGMVARYDPQKDHVNLIKALGMLKKSGKEFRCVLVGTGMDLSNSELVALIEGEDIEDRVLLLGRRHDIQEVMNAIDLHILSSSYGEAFPNVLAEAMACGTPCITTDVGDAALIVGETGWVVPPKNPEALLQTIAEALDEWQKPGKWDERKIAARERINDNFRIQNILETYVREWQDVYSRHS